MMISLSIRQVQKGWVADMNDVKMDESLVFDACALVEQITVMTDIKEIRSKAEAAASLLNRAMKEGEKVEKNHCSLD